MSQTSSGSRTATLSGNDLLELLGALAEAPDFDTGSGQLLEQFAEVATSESATMFALDTACRELRELHSIGGGKPGRAGRIVVSADSQGHPLIMSALGLEIVAYAGAPPPLSEMPFERWFSVPLPQPPFRGCPAPRAPRRVFEGLYAGCEIIPRSGASSVPMGLAPFGAIVFEFTAAMGLPDRSVIEAVANAAQLAGPILSRMQSVDSLHKSSERVDDQRSLLASIVDALPDPIVITDAGNSVIVQNQRAEHLLSPQAGDSEGRRRAVEINNLLFSSFLSKSVMAGGMPQSARDLNLVDPDEGTDLLFEVLAHPIAVAEGRESSVLSVLRDVTDLKRASNELQRQFVRQRITEAESIRERDRLNMILNNVGDPILVSDSQSKLIMMNPQAERLFDLPVESPDDRQIGQRVRGNDTRFATFISDFAISPSLFRREQLALTQPASGAALPVEVLSGKIMNERGEPLAIVSVLHDLTKQVENERLLEEVKAASGELEDRVRMATAHLEAQNVKLQWQSSELEKAYRLKSEFLANMSHELRTPINALIGYTALMLDRIYGELTSKQEEGLLRVQASSHHLLALINDILDLAKIEAGRMPVHLEPTSFKATVAEVIAQIEPLVRKKSLEFKYDLASDIPTMHTDRTKLKQIVLNLLSNAVKFTHKGQVTLAASLAGEHVEIVVSDTGIGIKPEFLDVIFEEFRQVDQSRTREYGGTGLGLSITRKLVALLGGAIGAESEYGRGTTFQVTLPIQSESLTAEEHIARAAIGAARP
ncbi:MAG: PAS domain-containing protein [Anaerolineae bacterium]|nr:PAS domain-containing protein [Gemmatimonadaceae bacterium]